MIQENQALLNKASIAIDGILVLLSVLLGFFVRFYIFKEGIVTIPFDSYVNIGIILIPIHLITYGLLGLYDSHRNIRLYRELGRLFAANLLDFVILQMLLFLVKEQDFSRLALLLFFVSVNASLGLKRIILRKFLHKIRKAGFNHKTVLIVGSGEVAEDYLREIQRNPEFGYDVFGYVGKHQNLANLTYYGTFGALKKVLDRRKPDEVIAALDMTEYSHMPDIIEACEENGVRLSFIPFYAQYMPARPQIDSLNGIPLINLRRIPLDNWGNAFLKRTLDVVGSIVLILLSSPLMLFAAVGVKLSSPGPVIFKQKRVGLNKKEFNMYKFRSMAVNSGSDTRWSTNRDSRKTKFGAFIRKFSIDELPQFFNVLKGDMSLVGPRPELPHFVKQFKSNIPLYMVKHQVRPGITGWAQVNGLRGDTSIEERIRHDIFYIENWTFLFDIKILLMTPFKGIVNQEKLH